VRLLQLVALTGSGVTVEAFAAHAATVAALHQRRGHPLCTPRRATPWSFDEARAYARSFGFATRDEYLEYRCPGAYALPRDPVATYGERWTSWADFLGLPDETPTMTQVLFVECGVGADQHGQNATKAAVRAARNAIEFNSIPSIEKIVPRGYDGMLLKLDVAAPAKYRDAIDLDAVRAVFPYGRIVDCALQDGGAVFRSGIAIEAMGDSNDEMVVVNVAVTVGY